MAPWWVAWGRCGSLCFLATVHPGGSRHPVRFPPRRIQMVRTRLGRSPFVFAALALALALVFAGLVAGCKERGPGAGVVAATDARIAHAVYDDSLETARRLRTAIENFVADPTDAGFFAARQA